MRHSFVDKAQTNRQINIFTLFPCQESLLRDFLPISVSSDDR